MKDTLTLLKDAYALLQDKSRWTTGSVARDADATPVSATNPHAQSFCAIGALWKASDLNHISPSQPLQKPLHQAISALAMALGHRSGCWEAEAIVQANDGPDGGYDVIMSGYRKAIADNTPVEGRPKQKEITVEKLPKALA